MFCQAQAAVQTKGVLVVFQHSIPTCGKEAMETNFHTRNYFRASIKLSCLQRVEAVILMNSDLCSAYVGQMLHILVFPFELQMTKGKLLASNN